MGIKINTETTCGLCFFSTVSAQKSDSSTDKAIFGAFLAGYFMFGILLGVGIWACEATSEKPMIGSLKDLCTFALFWPCLLGYILSNCVKNCCKTHSERRVHPDSAQHP